MNKEALYNPAHLKELCEQYDLRPSKQYGQNYLISENAIKKILEAAELSEDDHVVEIGPGFGVLTLALASRVASVTAFEIEQKIAPYWEETKKVYPNVEIIWGNVLSHFDQGVQNNRPYKIVANLPYQITSKVLRLMLEAEHKPERIVVMVQKEVAERICAKPGEMSLLAFAVQYYGSVRRVASVPKGAFFPSPKVDSAVIAITDLKPSSDEDAHVFKLARAGFGEKRKQMAKNISASLQIDQTVIQDALEAVGASKTARAQELSIDQWVKLSKIVL